MEQNWWLGPLQSGPSKLIALTGPKGVGKTTLAEQLIDHGDFLIRSLAKPVKEAAKYLYNLQDFDFFVLNKEVEDERYGLTPRQILQALGTEVCRAIHPATWLIKMRAELDKIGPEFMVVIDDLRFENEAEAVRAWGGVVVELLRDDVDYTGEHASERGVEADFTLNMRSTPESEAKNLLWAVDLHLLHRQLDADDRWVRSLIVNSIDEGSLSPNDVPNRWRVDEDDDAEPIGGWHGYV